MITSWDLRPHAVLVALLCAYALIAPQPSLATSILTADAFGGVSAGAITGTPGKAITPGEGSLAVTFGAAAGQSVTGIELAASLLGGGQARYGALAGHARAEATSSPPSPFLVGGTVVLTLGFLDTAVVVSSSLAPETPVTLTFVMTLDATAIHAANGLFFPGHIGAAARNEARIFDIEAGTSTPSLSPHTLVNSIGDSITLTTFRFDTAIGHRLQIDVDLMVAARATIEGHPFPGYASTGTAEVIADNTAHFFYQPSGDVRLVSESLHDYAVGGSGPGPGPAPVPEPGSLALLCVGGASMLVATRRRSTLRTTRSRRAA